jgi:hypothetical protein
MISVLKQDRFAAVRKLILVISDYFIIFDVKILVFIWLV